MSLDFNDETFRGDFTFSNSARAIKRFPFPFPEDSYMYSVNMEPHVPGPVGSVFEHMFDVDEHYVVGNARPGAGVGGRSAALPIAAAYGHWRAGICWN